MWYFFSALVFYDCPIVCVHLAFSNYAQCTERENELDECNAINSSFCLPVLYVLIIDRKKHPLCTYNCTIQALSVVFWGDFLVIFGILSLPILDISAEIGLMEANHLSADATVIYVYGFRYGILMIMTKI